MINDENNRIAVALGDFDGMHLAHKTVITGARDTVIYSVNNRFSLLQRSIFERWYPNTVFADFEKIKDMDGKDFIEEVLINEFHAGVVLCGFNFRFGKGAKWDAFRLREYLESKDVWVRILEHLDYDSKPISSSRIRAELLKGNVAEANKMLGYPFTFESEVLHGDRRGTSINFPTINQHFPDGLIIPKYGVYESAVYIGGERYRSFTNIGIRPSFRVDEPLAETHIFDYDGDLYSQCVRVELIDYIREEKEFNSTEELRKQLEKDKGSII